jgi:hypothetical protein
MKKLRFPMPDLSDDDVPEELRAQWERTQQVADEAAQRCAQWVDDEITKAIQMRIGTGWTPMQLTGRLHRTLFLDGSEILVMDGVPLLHIGPWILAAVGPSTQQIVTREVTHLKGAHDPRPN